jgi:membrane protease YdiL (CAAX protease family)
MNEGGWVMNVCIFFGVCIAPATEEFMFRGVLFAGLARRLPGVLAGLISISAFGLMHISSASPYWAAIVAVSLLALAAQLARVRTGSLVPGIAMHTVYNAAVFALGFVLQP